MSARTVTVKTLDHGPVTVTEPSWCTGHAGQPVEFRTDLCHTGPLRTLSYDERALWYAEVVAYPFAVDERRGPGLYVEAAPFARTLAPADVDRLAAVLVEHAARLRHMARELAVLRGGVR
ncbi:hypothetical protein LUW75_10765 [Streptomyces sp. MRC013]|uniref:DUF6907 domain-containing protein n=1 Tax=Streptomyces sp. MRC013 TaxID=2898276 RepID=UPI0020272EA2|nr:hypothetical protein [Streptomyces sp. MRC013]URM90395.1 hypothetical protein LUW75_10765 [Streptomyces sp. MRC013]